MPLLPDRLPWYVAGPLIGLLLIVMYSAANRTIGVSGSYLEVLGFLRRRPSPERWRVWFFGGIFAGALAATALRGGPALGLDYGTLSRALPLAALVPLLFLAGLLMGYGARWAGGCTSGHGICGTSALSPGSFVATATFMAAAVVVTAVLHFVTGGAL
ncbi:MAG: YeeE/YedE family protein [Chloroflexi bacterium]|nr:YeeE/YedE family protein [Chloroflexota bacterium]